MTKSDLRDGMVVKIRDGKLCIVIGNRIISDNGWLSLDVYMEDLTYQQGSEFYDIVAIYDIPLRSLDLNYWTEGKKPIWVRTEETIMTISDIEKRLGIKNLKIVSEDNYE